MYNYPDCYNLVWEIFITDPNGVRSYDGSFDYKRNVDERVKNLLERGYTDPELIQVARGNHGQSWLPRVKP